MTRRKRPTSVAAYEQTAGRLLRDASHARRDVVCKSCHEVYVAWAFVSPDPTGAAERRVERKVADWLKNHPCTSVIFAHPRKVERAA